MRVTGEGLGGGGVLRVEMIKTFPMVTFGSWRDRGGEIRFPTVMSHTEVRLLSAESCHCMQLP